MSLTSRTADKRHHQSLPQRGCPGILRRSVMAASPILPPEAKPIPEPKPTIEEKIAELRAKRTLIQQGGGKKRIDKQHADGKLTAPATVEKLFDRAHIPGVGIFA